MSGGEEDMEKRSVQAGEYQQKAKGVMIFYQ